MSCARRYPQSGQLSISPEMVTWARKSLLSSWYWDISELSSDHRLTQTYLSSSVGKGWVLTQTSHFHMVSMEAWTKARLCSSDVRLHPRILYAWAQSTDKSVVGIPGVPVTSVLKAILEAVVQQKTNYLMLCRLPLALCIWSLFILKQTSVVTSAIWNKVA